MGWALGCRAPPKTDRRPTRSRKVTKRQRSKALSLLYHLLSRCAFPPICAHVLLSLILTLAHYGRSLARGHKPGTYRARRKKNVHVQPEMIVKNTLFIRAKRDSILA
ncbi:unnamed protein product [Pylaiella littoralis]